MALTLNTLSLTTWRNFKEKTLEVAPGLTVLVGPNAAGKTNTIEALQYLTAGTSFRKPSPKELIYEGEDSACIKAQLSGDGRLIDVEMQVKESSRRFLRNGKPVKTNDFIGTLFSILFNPDDLLLVKSSASHRRDELDGFGAQLYSSYRNVYSTYIRSIEQRNHLLKEGIDGVLLDSWDESVALGAATLLQYRLRMFKKLRTYLQVMYQEITTSEILECTYNASATQNTNAYPDNQSLYEASRDELVQFIVIQLKECRDEDLRRAHTSIGPHRDDIIFTINGRDARKYGSQGQQRSIVLAWKMAEVLLCEEMFGVRPLLLLDDVMSELDEQRRSCITNFIKEGIQTVITTTNLGYFNEEDLKDAKVIEYGLQ